MICLLNRKPDDQSNNYVREHPCYSNQCARCGWNAKEHQERIARGLTRGEDGLKHFTKTKVGEITDDSTETP